MTIGEVYSHLLNELKARYAYEEAKAMVVILLEHHLQLSKAKIMLQFNIEVPDYSLPPLAKALDELLSDKPVQYVLGKTIFMDNEFRVNESVLIPRPETEELVQEIINELSTVVTDSNFPLRILDIGTGSGCIAITLKNHFPDMSVYALDKSEDALQIARINASNLRSEIIFLNVDILNQDDLEGLPSFDVIVSNPPYVTVSEQKDMKPNVLDYEPGTALFVPDNDPLLFYRAISDFASFFLRPGGYIFLEINESFGDEVKSLFINSGFNNTEIKKDLSGKDRFLFCRS